MDNLISNNYQEMVSIPGNQDNELNKFFETIDNLNKPFKPNESKFNLNVKDENGNSILHRIIINSLNEQELLNKIQFIPNIETLINTVNFKHQTPLHLLCKYQYYNAYLLLKNILEGNEIDYLTEEENIRRTIKNDNSIIITKTKDKGINIRYDILDAKNRLPLSYLVMGVNIDNLRINYDNTTLTNDIIKNAKLPNTNLNNMMQYFNKKDNCNNDVNISNIFNDNIDIDEINNDIYHLILNNKYVKRYINKKFIDDIYDNTIKTVPYDRFVNINVDNMNTLNYFIKDDKTIKTIPTKEYYLVFSKYINNKLVSLDATFKSLSKEKQKKFIDDNVQKIIEDKTPLINKVFMDNQV